MHIFGKIIGVFFGYLFGGPWGAIFGFILGHRFDAALGSQGSAFTFSQSDNRERQDAFFKSAFAVMGHVTKAKGQVRQEDIHLATLMMERMNLSAEQRKAAQDAFRQGKQAAFPLDDELEKVKINTGGRFDLLQFFLELQITAAFADGELDPRERHILHRIAGGLGFSSAQLERRLRMHEAAHRFQQNAHFGTGSQHERADNQSFWQQHDKNNLADAYSVLGVDDTADAKQVKRAYRKMMNEHHPDKLMAKGLPPEMMTMAKEKSQEIQKAYDLIKQEKGF